MIRELPNWRQQTSIGCSNFVPDVLFQLLMCAEISSHPLRLTIVPTDSQARRGQETWLARWRHQNMERQGHMALNSFTCYVRGGTVLAETRAHHRRRQLPRLSPALLDIVLRLGSLYSCLVLHARETTHQMQCISSCHRSAQAICRGPVWAGGQKSTHLDRRHGNSETELSIV